MKKCSFCGTENSDRAILCELCGRRFKPENEEQIDEPLIINEEKLKDAINRTGETNMVKGARHTDYPLRVENTNRYYSDPVQSNIQQVPHHDYKQKSNNTALIIIVFAIAAVLAAIFISISSGKRNDDKGFIKIENEIDILADEITVTIGQTEELRISSTVPKLYASFNGCIDVYWNDGKASDDTYYLEVTGKKVGSCCLKVNERDNADLYDTVVINVVASDDEVVSSDSLDDSIDIGPAYTTISVPTIVPSTLTIDSILPNTFTAEAASILSYSGNILTKTQNDSYYFEAPYDGRYRIDVSGVQSGAAIELYLFNASGEVIVSDLYCKNKNGITAKGLLAGEIYEVQVRYASGFSNYNLTIGQQKPTVDISSLTQLTDSIEYTDQRNVYTFTVPIDGRYRFELSGMMSGTAAELYVFNSLGETVVSDTYCMNGDGVTVKDLLAGEIYEVQVRYASGFSNYNLTIGQQKPTVDISSLTQLTDSIEYTDQRNVYTFTVPIDGRYRFELSGMMSGTAAELCVFNSLGEMVAANTYCMNGDGVTVKGLLAEDTYQVQVRYASGFSSYNLTIGQQKKITDIGNNTIIYDSIEYTDQRNVYSFTATTTGDVKISISELTNGAAVELMVYNDLVEKVASNTYCQNDDELTIQNVSAGKHYEIQVRHSLGMSGYKLIIN